MWGGIGADVQEQVVATVLAAAGPQLQIATAVYASELRRCETPFNRHALWQVAADAGIIALAWALAWLLRFDQGRPVYYDRYLDWQIILVVVGIQLRVFALSGFYNRWWRYVSTRDMWSALRGVCSRRSRPSSSSPSSSCIRRACRPASGSSTCSSASRSWPARAARADADRAAAPRAGGRARERRRSSSGPATPPSSSSRRCSGTRARLHADRDRRRRPPQAQPAPARHPRARHARRPAPADPRPPAGRGADRHPVRVG